MDKSHLASENKCIDQMATSLMNHHVPRIAFADQTLHELGLKQNNIHTQLTKHNEKLTNGLNTTGIGIQEMLSQTKNYQIKLSSLVKEMTDLSERSQRIKKRALKMEQQKQHDALNKEQTKDRELEREKKLIARPAKRN